MKRRAFLGTLASGGAVGLAGCTTRRQTLLTVDAEPTIAAGEFYHERLDVPDVTSQLNLRYTVEASDEFDVLLFGGQSDPAEFDVYRRAVRGRADERPEPSEWHSVLGAEGTASVNRPLHPGTHHFVVDNTTVGEAAPDGPLRATVDLSVRDFQLLPD